MPRIRATLCTVAVLALTAAPAALAQDEYVPTFTPSSYWLHANGSLLGNVDSYQGNYVKWDATKPTGAAPAHYLGANYYTLTDTSGKDPAAFMTMAGKVKGDIDNLAFDIYFVGPSQATIGCGVSFAVQLKIDGETVLDQEYTGSEGFNDMHFDETTERTQFVLTNIWNATRGFSPALKTGPDVQHDVQVILQNFYACNEYVFRYDSADYPAGFIANMPNIEESGYFLFDVMEPPPPVG